VLAGAGAEEKKGFGFSQGNGNFSGQWFLTNVFDVDDFTV
jgi:hypothetical protein